MATNAELQGIENRLRNLEQWQLSMGQNVNVQPALNDPQSAFVQDGGVTAAKLASASVTTEKIGDDEVTSAKIASLVVDKLAAGELSVLMDIVAGGIISWATGQLDGTGIQILSDGTTVNGITWLDELGSEDPLSEFPRIALAGFHDGNQDAGGFIAEAARNANTLMTLSMQLNSASSLVPEFKLFTQQGTSPSLSGGITISPGITFIKSGQFAFAGGSVTTEIASGVAIINSPRVVLESESGSSDTLTTITSAADHNIQDAQASELIIVMPLGGHTITVSHGTGNINLAGGANATLDAASDMLLLVSQELSGDWYEMGRSF